MRDLTFEKGFFWLNKTREKIMKDSVKYNHSPFATSSIKCTRSLMKLFAPHFSFDSNVGANQGKVQFIFDI